MRRLYRERYTGFNGRHFYQIARQQHGVTLSYTYVKIALQQPGLLPKGRRRGRHRGVRARASASGCTWTAAAIRRPRLRDS